MAFILIKQRCSPFKGKLRQGFDNDFGFGVGKDIFGKDVEYPQREMQEVKLFKIKDFVKKAKEEKMAKMGSPFDTKNLNNPMQSMQPQVMPGLGNSNFDIDQMIKDIDKKIAELEKEEEEEKKKQAKQLNEVENNKETTEEVKKPIEEEYEIIKPTIIEDSSNENKKDSDIVDSKLIDFDNFTVKDNNVSNDSNNNNNDSETAPDLSTKEKNDNQDNNYDDFFDDFFYEE